jgi:hypothetical protein
MCVWSKQGDVPHFPEYLAAETLLVNYVIVEIFAVFVLDEITELHDGLVVLTRCSVENNHEMTLFNHVVLGVLENTLVRDAMVSF